MSIREDAHPAPADALAHFHEELVSLLSAGLPLDRSLLKFRFPSTGTADPRFAKVTAQLENGHSLEQAMAEEASSLPTDHRAIWELGLSSLHLPMVVEAVVDAARQFQQVRQRMRQMICYLTALGLCALGSLWVFCNYAAAAFANYDIFSRNSQSFMAALSRLGKLPWWYWAAAAAVVVCVGGIFWWRAGTQINWFGARQRSLLTPHQQRLFCRVLSSLMAEDRPLAEIVPLAGRACGNPQIAIQAEEVGRRLTAGDANPTRGLRAPFPPAARLAIQSWAQGKPTSDMLKQAAESFRLQADRIARWRATVLPQIWLVIIGGAICLIYMLGLWGPWVLALRKLAGDI